MAHRTNEAAVSIFTAYTQPENQLTNYLMAILSMARLECPRLVKTLLGRELGLKLDGGVTTFRVLQGLKSTADAEISGKGFCIHIESKIVPESLRRDQITAHLEHLADHKGQLKRLVLLTPDDSSSDYIRRIRSIDQTRILHLGWSRVYEFLRGCQACMRKGGHGLFAELVRQFLDQIQEMVFRAAGVVLKIDFGPKSAVDPKTYIAGLQASKHPCWNTPRRYPNLDGKGRMLLLYDRNRQGITIEAGVRRIIYRKKNKDYPCYYYFIPGTLRPFEPPIPLERIRKMSGLQNFGKYRKDRSAYRNLSHDQYGELIASRKATARAGNGCPRWCKGQGS